MEAIVYYTLHLVARKNLFVHISYVLATLAFVTFSYQSAHLLYEIPTKISVSIPDSSTSMTSQILNVSSTHEQRINSIKSQCSNTRYSSIIHEHRKLLNHLAFFLRSRSLFYCSVPKVATRTLLNYITYFHIREEIIPSLTNQSSIDFHDKSNSVNIGYINQMLNNSKQSDSLLVLRQFLMAIQSNASQFDLWAMFQKSTLPRVRLNDVSDPSIIFSSSFTRAIFVRHPLERLASAYADKIDSIKAEPMTLYDSLRRRICRKYASSYLTNAEQHAYHIQKSLENHPHEPCAKVIPTFEHFVEHILSDTAQVDVHWQPYSILCGVCRMNYNFIGKYETLQEDLHRFQLKLNLNITDWNIGNHFSTGKTKETYQSMYSTLPHDLLCNLKNFYHQDLRLFNYHFEDYLPNQQQINCTLQRYRRFNALTF